MSQLLNDDMRERLAREKEIAREAGRIMREAMASMPRAPTMREQTKLHRHKRWRGALPLPKMRYSPGFYIAQERLRKMHARGEIGGARFNVLIEIARNMDQRDEIHWFDIPAECRKLDAKDR